MKVYDVMMEGGIVWFVVARMPPDQLPWTCTHAFDGVHGA